MIKLDVVSDFREVSKMLDDCEKKVVAPAAAKSLNRTIKRVKTLSVRELAKVLNIPQKVLRKRMAIGRKHLATRRKLSASMLALLEDVLLSDIAKGRQTKTGVTVKGKSYDHAFKATVSRRGGSYDGVFRRSGRSRYPIKSVKVPIDQKTQPAISRILKGSDKFFRKTFEHDVNYRLRKLRYK